MIKMDELKEWMIENGDEISHEMFGVSQNELDYDQIFELYQECNERLVNQKI